MLTRQPSLLGVKRLVVSCTVYRLSWWLIFSVHLLNGALVLVTSATYLIFSQAQVYQNVALLQIPRSTLQLSGWSYLALGCVHAHALWGLISQSARAGRLTFGRALLSENPDNKARVQPTEAELPTRHWCDPRGWLATARRKYSSWFGVDGALGINGAYFYRAYVVREVIEVGLQTYQANQLSRSVTRPSINALAVATIMFNCVSTPLVFHVFRNREMMGRLASILVDMVLDFTSSTVIPMAIMYPYLAVYDQSAGTMPMELVRDDAWFVGALEVINQSAVTSLVDYFASLLPHVSVMSCLNIAKSAIHRSQRLERRLSMRLIDISTSIEATSPSMVAIKASQPRISIHSILSLVWAIFVLVAHLAAQHHTTEATIDQSCRLHMKPWFTTQHPCAVIQINCYRGGIVGRSDEIAAWLLPFDRSMAKKIIITHCPALEIPPVLQEFRGLMIFAVFNVTVASWQAQATITSSSHPRFSTIELFTVNVSCPLEGIFHDSMPRAFSYFTLTHSNLTALPDDLGDKWPQLQVFNVQLTSLRRLPSTFSRLRIKRLRLISNALETIDELSSSTDPQQFSDLHLSGNPLQRLPASIGDVSQLTGLLVEDTGVAVVPDQLLRWLQTAKLTTVSFNGSPVCSSAELSPAIQALLCTNRFGDALGTLAWDAIAAQRPL